MHDEEEEEEEEVVKKLTWPIYARCKAGNLQTRSSTACDMLMKDGAYSEQVLSMDPSSTRIHYTCFELDQLGHPARELRDLRAHARGAAA